jgi:hypothetical protein
MLNHLKIFIVLCLLPVAMMAQTQEATTNSGKKVLLYSNGTWKYAEELSNEKVKEKEKEKKNEPEKITQPVNANLPADCAERIDVSEDKKSGSVTRKVKNMLIISKEGSSNEVDISMQKGAKGVITVTFRAHGAGDCIGEGNKINLVFSDGSKADLVNDAFSNCRNESVANFGASFGRKKILEELMTKRVNSIRIWTQQGSVTVDLNSENQNELQSMIRCLNAS